VTSLLAVFRDELRRVLALRPVFMVLVVGIAIYALLYPQPYISEALRRVPIALVDLDGTVASRELARRVDATSDVAVAMVLPDLPTAEREVFARSIYGILLIPKDFERELLHGRSSPVALYADASYFLMYQRMAGAVGTVAHTFAAEVQTPLLVATGVSPLVAAAVVDPMPLTTVPLFNPQGGYATYILPAALTLILQQTLLIGVGLLGTLPGADLRRRTPPIEAGAIATVLGKLLAYLAFEAVIVPFYLVSLPWLYGLPRLGSLATILVFATPFVLAVGALGMVVARLLREPLLVQLALAALGLPFFFLAGFSWPVEAIPEGVRLFAILVPSTSAIDGLVRVAQLGASLADVRRQFLALWALAAFYGICAMLIEAAKARAGAGRAAAASGASSPTAQAS
jgi:ABC-2 type transport system permease protein